LTFDRSSPVRSENEQPKLKSSVQEARSGLMLSWVLLRGRSVMDQQIRTAVVDDRPMLFRQLSVFVARRVKLSVPAMLERLF
jgi:hypothetical protein